MSRRSSPVRPVISPEEIHKNHLFLSLLLEDPDTDHRGTRLVSDEDTTTYTLKVETRNIVPIMIAETLTRLGSSVYE